MVDVDKLTQLARIKLDSQEKENLQKEFEAILGYISELQKADLSVINKEEKEIPARKNVLREDANAHQAGEFSKELLESAPSAENNFIKVKHVFE